MGLSKLLQPSATEQVKPASSRPLAAGVSVLVCPHHPATRSGHSTPSVSRVVSSPQISYLFSGGFAHFSYLLGCLKQKATHSLPFKTSSKHTSKPTSQHQLQTRFCLSSGIVRSAALIISFNVWHRGRLVNAETTPHWIHLGHQCKPDTHTVR